MKRMHHSRVVVIVALVATAAAMVAADDWPQWRGPESTGASSEASWNAAALSRPDAVSWKINVGKGHSTVIVVGKRLFTMGSELRDDEVVAEVVYCLDVASGRVVWKYPYAAEHRQFPGPGSTPVVDGDFVYTVGRDGKVHCLAAADGSVRWRRDIVAEGLVQPNHWGFCGSALVEGNLVVLNAGSAGMALDKRNGQVVWSSEPAGNGHATPVAFDFKGQRLVAIGGTRTLNIVDLATGEVKWSQAWRSHRDPDILGEQMMLSGGLRGDGSALFQLNGGDPTELWSNRNLASEFMSGVQIDGFSYGFGRQGNRRVLQCVETKSGELKWDHDLSGYGGLSAAGGRLIIIDGDGDLIIATANPTGFKELARTKVFTHIGPYRSYPDNDPNACWTAPVLANGRIFVRSSYGDLACVDVTG